MATDMKESSESGLWLCPECGQLTAFGVPCQCGREDEPELTKEAWRRLEAAAIARTGGEAWIGC